MASRASMIGDESPRAQNKLMFLECLGLIERLHRRLLDVIKDELDACGKGELNPVQALLLFNIGEYEMTAGELRTRGYYLGSNVSYNIKKLVEMGFIHHQRALHDRRAVRISLTEKGKEVRDMIDEMYERQLDEILEDDLLDAEKFTTLRRTLRNLERFWGDHMRVTSGSRAAT